MDFFRKHSRIIFIITIVMFFASTFLGLGSAVFYSTNETAVSVNGKKISSRLFDSVYYNFIDAYEQSLSNQPLTEEITRELKAKTVQSLVENEIFYQQAIRYGIEVSDDELKVDLQNSPMFKNESNIFDLQTYYSFLNKIKLSPKEYEKLRKKQIAGNKLKALLVPAVRLWNYETTDIIKEGTDTSVALNAAFQSKVNAILNEWYSNVVRNSAVIVNENIFANKS
ncbi:MAG: SurA N-terminal domain-containing protein [Elusimicrobiota bacterium]|jgi:hypothetical protein|nr:SurA N-terminal domain-containing protein [Elusimicrobiota bacterium]